MLKKIQIYTCPNPNCQRKFDNLIITYDNSKTPAQVYYACPYCLFKLDPTTTQSLKKEEIFVEEKTENRQMDREREIPPGCPQYLGYLSSHPKDHNIPQECLICPRILECTKK